MSGQNPFTVFTRNTQMARGCGYLLLASGTVTFGQALWYWLTSGGNWGPIDTVRAIPVLSAAWILGFRLLGATAGWQVFLARAFAVLGILVALLLLLAFTASTIRSGITASSIGLQAWGTTRRIIEETAQTLFSVGLMLTAFISWNNSGGDRP